SVAVLLAQLTGRDVARGAYSIASAREPGPSHAIVPLLKLAVCRRLFARIYDFHGQCTLCCTCRVELLVRYAKHLPCFPCFGHIRRRDIFRDEPGQNRLVARRGRCIDSCRSYADCRSIVVGRPLLWVSIGSETPSNRGGMKMPHTLLYCVDARTPAH